MSPQSAFMLGFIGIGFATVAVIAAILAWNWTGGICLAIGTALLFTCFYNLH